MTTDVPSRSPLLTVKRVIPPVRAGAVRRARLEERLRDADTRLTLVAAPAGWGKTSLLSGWASAPGADVVVAWVSLDEGDDEPARFWSYVLTALGEAADGLGAEALEALRTPGAAPVDHALPVLLNELAATTRRHVLVLDDYHLLADRRIHEGLEYVVGYLPPSLRIVVAARRDPPLPLARLRAGGELTELRAAELRFSVAEAAHLVAAVSGTDVDEDGVRTLWERTEGWAAGLQLSGLGLRGRGGDGRPAHHRHALDYLAAEVLPDLAPAQRDLLVATAPLARLSGSLCDAVLDRTGSADVLEELDRADLFVVGLDEHREWYRCHGLLQDALRREAGAGDGEVLRRAAAWFADRGRLDDAAEHRILGGDAEGAAALMTAEWMWFVERGVAASYERLGARLPVGVVSPTLALCLAYAAAIAGRPDRAWHWLDVCDARITPADVVAGWRDGRAAALMCRAMIATSDAEPGRAVELAEEAVRRETAGGETASPPALAALGSAYARDARFADAVPLLREAWRTRNAGAWTRDLSLQLGGVLGLALGDTDQDEELERLVQQAGPLADAVERAWGPSTPVAASVRIVEGRHAYRRGEIDAARAVLARAVTAAEAGARPSVHVAGLVFLADAELAAGRRAAARRALAVARDVVDEGEPVLPHEVERLVRAEQRIGREAARSAHDRGALPETLTDRELSILRALTGTATRREIADALFLSINTVKAYTRSLYRKLGVASRPDAVAVARSLGLI
ncbi:helix-turn-helix transcriptional regulator [Actinomycetospora sp. NBRC 106375]|uniref:LuxR C-terminal-related transcriptional regulator n=1 Tax=Actinomycetospora sp. NBRC 106375 TaxID=3032207 RepID=UPI0024A4A4B3|nr:LuxR C-terminal-related transcriptional regulator [Actinomycetospora sp. NBRC 106375]GLZ45277.1 helix-turn-helix transcriptional regulator [Actinomycetospora sp. NBRC 106375]